MTTESVQQTKLQDTGINYQKKYIHILCVI